MVLRDMAWGGLGSTGLTVALNDLQGLFQPKDSVILRRGGQKQQVGNSQEVPGMMKMEAVQRHAVGENLKSFSV